MGYARSAPQGQILYRTIYSYQQDLAGQTSGDLLRFHTHIHDLVLDGVMYSTGEFTKLPQCDLALIQAKFEHKIFDELFKEGLIGNQFPITGPPILQHENSYGNT